MARKAGDHRLHSGWWALIMVSTLVVFVVSTAAVFSGTFRSFVPVTLTADRTGLVMENGAKVKMRGVQVGRVGGIEGGSGPVRLKLEIDPAQVARIPANIEAQISVTTAFGAKFVDLIPPENPTTARLSAGAVLMSRNVTTEVNTVFENIVDLLDMVDPAKVNAVLSAIADAVRGQGPRMGEATAALNRVLTEVNARSETLHEDWRSFGDFSATYAAVADDIVSILDSASTTSATIVERRSDLDSLLLNVTGFAQSGSNLLATSKDSFIEAVNTFAPTTELLHKYNPIYTCTLQGSTWFLENGGWDIWGGANGRSIQLDVALLGGNDAYKLPENLPIIAAKGGPGGQPGCGSLPDASKNFPVRQLVTNTGWGTGVDFRPNPGIGNPCWVNYFPVTRGVPEAPSIRECIPGPAIGPVPYPGAPPYGAALYGPGGAPLWPGLPPAPVPAPTPEGAPTP